MFNTNVLTILSDCSKSLQDRFLTKKSPMTTEDPSPPGLFAQRNFAIVRSRALSLEAAQKALNKLLQLESTIKSHDGNVTLDDYDQGGKLPVWKFSYIIASLADFPDYDVACNNYIPVVKPDWISACLSKSKLVNTRQYNPDPRLFLSGVVVCCADLPEGDTDAIVGGVVAMGGLHSTKVASMVTHVVALTMDSEKCQAVVLKSLDIKIVLPHWFDDCLKLGRRIDERPYLLPNPEILQNNGQKPPTSGRNPDLAGACTPDPTGPSIDTPPISPRGGCQVFNRKKILLAEDLNLGSHLRGAIEEIIQRGGGSISSDVHEADMYIGKYRDGEDYRIASRARKDVGNLSWLFHLITNNVWTSPSKRLLHYPVARNGLPGFKEFRISLSNYSGEARVYLENLITATGAEPTKTLKQDNTHLITAHIISEKCQAAQDWGIHRINHLWLEESYAKWKLQSVTNPRYTHFPSRTNLGEVVGHTSIDRKAMEQAFFSPEEDVEMDDGDEDSDLPAETADAGQIPQSSVVDESRKRGRKAAKILSPKVTDDQALANTRKPRTPATTRHTAPGKENETPGTGSSRKSKDAAAARLHGYRDDIALYEKERKRVGGVVYGGRKKHDEDRVGHARKRSLEEDEGTDSTVGAASREVKKQKPASPMHLLVTKFGRWVDNMSAEADDKKRLRALGISITQDPARCTHLVAPSILRTQKFVVALSYAPVIISSNFIEECLSQNKVLNPQDYLLQDPSGERKLNLDLSRSLSLAKQNKNSLFAGRTIYCVDTIPAGFATFQAIVEANGGRCITYRGRPGTMVPSRRAGSEASTMTDEDTDAEIYLLSGLEKEHKVLWPKFRKMAEGSRKIAKIVGSDWVLESAMAQKILPVEEYEHDG
ncbi:MAG: hypothetical protein Q9227_007012 [Pyrenula ochraceoflavens]